jgi:hypothetical protein
MIRKKWFSVLSFVLLIFIVGELSAAESPIKYINYSIENGSPVFWENQDDGSILVSLMYDHERNSPNRAAGHWHFQVFADKGSQVKLVLQNFDNIWNGKVGSPIHDNTTSYISTDGKTWKDIPTNKTKNNQMEIDLTMTADSMFVARLEPYRISDLDNLKSEIQNHPLVKITNIGKTAQGRDLEIIRVGHINAPFRVLLRARAHAWEPGGNWVVQGMIHNLLKTNPQIEKYLQTYCVYIIPMANKDMVAFGGTRFNVGGMDLNRKWEKSADPYLSPENAALENWLNEKISQNLKPHLAIDFHNDAGGNLHISRPNINLDNYLKNMAFFEKILRQHSWYTEGSTGGNFRNPGTFGEGLLERFGIDAFVYELNANWIAGLNKVPYGKDWELLGKQLCEVFYSYFNTVEYKK